MLLLIYGCAYLLKRYAQLPSGTLNGRTPAPREADTIYVLHRQRVATHTQLQLIEVNQVRMLVAVHDQGVSLLKEFPPEGSRIDDSLHEPHDTTPGPSAHSPTP